MARVWSRGTYHTGTISCTLRSLAFSVGSCLLDAVGVTTMRGSMGTLSGTCVEGLGPQQFRKDPVQKT